MATLEQIEQALRAADAAGNTDDARRLAQAYADMRGQQQAPPAPAGQPPASQKPMEINVSGGTPGEAPSVEELDALRNGTAKPNPANNSAFARMVSGQPAEPQVQEGNAVGRFLGEYGGRQVLQGAAGLYGSLGGDALNHYVLDPIDRAAGWGTQLGTGGRTYREAAAQVADEQGMRRPQNARERIISDVGEGLTGTALTMGIGAGLNALTNIGRAAPVTNRLADLLTSNPALQTISTATGAGASSAVREGGGGTGLQIAAGVLGGLSPNVAAGTVSAAGNRLTGLSWGDRAAGNAIRTEAANPEYLNFVESSVPGVRRTLGEATADPGLMALENTMRADRKATFDQIDRANNLARVNMLEDIAGTEAQMRGAKLARSRASSEPRKEAMAAGPVDISQTIAYLDDAIKGQEGRPAIQSGLQDLRKLLAKDVEPSPGLVVTEPENRLEVIDNVRQTIGDMLSGKYGADTTKALKGSHELMAVRDALNDEVTKQVPAFGEYLDAYRMASGPINRMETGRRLLQKATGATPDETGTRTLLPAQFSRANNDLDAIAAKATSFKKAKASDILTRDDLDALAAIQADMSRQFRRQSSATAGSQTYERGSIAERTAVKTGLRAVPFINPAIEALEKSMTNRMRERLAYLMANPEEAKRVLAALKPNDQALLRRTFGQLAPWVGATIPARPQEEPAER